MNDFAKFLGNAIVILAGWWVVHSLTKSRDVQKSRRDLVVKSSEHLEEVVAVLLEKAQKYHSSARNILVEREIKMDLQDIGQRLSALDRILEDRSAKSECNLRMRALRQSITGRHFEDEHMTPLAENDELFQEILNSVAQFKRGLLYLRYKQYDIRRS